jgi:SAM-dependent methyltransferase
MGRNGTVCGVTFEGADLVDRVVIDPREFADDLVEVAEGVWASRTSRDVSYPAMGHNRTLAVEDESFWYAHRNRCVLAVVRRFPPSGPIFDVGGGNGVVAAALVAAGIDAVLVEPGDDGAANARRRGLRPVVHSTLEDAGFRPCSLPAAGLFDVVEHMADDRGFLREVAGLVQPGGRLYITVPAHRWLWSVDDDIAGHHRRYTKRSMRRLLEDVGVRPEYLTYTFGWLAPAVFAFRTVPSRLGRRRQVTVERRQREHSLPRGRAGSVAGELLRREAELIERGRALAVGASVLAVATVAAG